MLPTPRCKGCGVKLDMRRRGQRGMPLAYHLAGNIECCREYADLDEQYGGHIATFPAVDVPVILDSLHYQMTSTNQERTWVAVRGVSIIGVTHEFARCASYSGAAAHIFAMKNRSNSGYHNRDRRREAAR